MPSIIDLFREWRTWEMSHARRVVFERIGDDENASYHLAR
jgi:hypothetical protein